MRRIMWAAVLAIVVAGCAAEGSAAPVTTTTEPGTTQPEITRQAVCERWWDISAQFSDGTSRAVIETRLRSLADMAQEIPARDGSPTSYFVDQFVALADVLDTDQVADSDDLTDLVLAIGSDCDHWRP